MCVCVRARMYMCIMHVYGGMEIYFKILNYTM